MGKGWFHIKSGEADRLKPPTRRTFFDKQQLAPVESVGEAQLFTPFTIHEPALGPSKSLAATPQEAASVRGAQDRPLARQVE